MAEVEADAVGKKQFLVGWEEFHKDCRILSQKLLDIRTDWKGIVAITTGGMIPAGIISWEMELKLIDVIGISSYGGYDDRNQKSLRLLKNFDVDMVGDGTGWLVIDDLVDSGTTVKAVREKIPQAHYASVYAKPKGEPLIDTFAVAVTQEEWIYFPWYLKDGQPIDPIVYSLKKD